MFIVSIHAHVYINKMTHIHRYVYVYTIAPDILKKFPITKPEWI